MFQGFGFRVGLHGPRRRLVLILTIALGSTALWSLSRPGPPASEPVRLRHWATVALAPRNSQLYVAIGAEPMVLDPHDAGDAPSTLVNFHVYDRLVELDDAMNPVPALALSWESSEDERAWILQLRKDVRFHDGSHFTASAVVANLERLMDPGSGLARRSLLGDYLESVRAIGRYTVRIKLRHPVGGFLRLLAHEAHGIVSPTSIVASQTSQPFTPIGTGPFAVDSWIPGTRLTLKAFRDYWGGAPHFEHLSFLTIPDGSNRSIMLETGAIDLAYPLDPIDLIRLHENPELTVVGVPSQRMIYLAANLADATLRDVRTRRAISLAIDRDALTKHILFGMGRPADSPLAPETWGHHNPGEIRYDPALGKTLLSTVFGESRRPTLELWSPANRYPQDKVIAQAVAAYLTRIGFDVRLSVFEWGTYLSRLRQSRDWSLALLGWVPSTGDADMALRPLFFSTARGNHSGYASERIDTLLTKGARSDDASSRLNTYRQVQEQLVHDLPAIWLYTVDMAVGYRSVLKDVRMVSTETLDLRHARRKGELE